MTWIEAWAYYFLWLVVGYGCLALVVPGVTWLVEQVVESYRRKVEKGND